VIKVFLIILVLFAGIANNYSQGISIGGSADIGIDAEDGDHFKIQSLDLKGVYFLTLVSEELFFTRKVVFL